MQSTGNKLDEVKDLIQEGIYNKRFGGLNLMTDLFHANRSNRIKERQPL